jgi:hypothetical protein
MNKPANAYALILLLGATLLLGACATDQPAIGPEAPNQNATGAPSYQLPITDIPIPAGAKLVDETTLIMGAQDRWLGRIVIKSDISSSQALNHFINGIPGLGWTAVTVVQGRISNLTFLRGERVASILIEPASLSGLVISITVSPRQQATTQENVRPKKP